MNDGDQIRRCRYCAGEFTFCEGEQAWYADHGYAPPKTCPPCRRLKKARLNAQPGRQREAVPPHWADMELR